MKIKYVRFVTPIRVILPRKAGFTENTHFSTEEAYDHGVDIELVKFSHFLITNRATQAIIAIVPFGQAAYCYPAEEKLSKSLDEMTDDELDTDGAESWNDPLNEMPQRPEKASGKKGKNGSTDSAAETPDT